MAQNVTQNGGRLSSSFLKRSCFRRSDEQRLKMDDNGVPFSSSTTAKLLVRQSYGVVFSPTMVVMLRAPAAKACAIRISRSEAIGARYMSLEPSVLWKSVPKRGIGVVNGGRGRLEALSALCGGVFGLSGRDEASSRLGSLRLSPRIDVEVLRRSGVRRRSRVVCEGGVGGEPQRNRLASIIKNKQRILESQLRSMADGELESRLALTKAVTKPYSLLDTIAQQIMEGRTAIILEVARLSPAETPEMLAERCVNYVEWGATALAICTDEENSPNGLADLTAVCQAVKVPILRRDWIIHPLQIADTCEAGASALTAVYSVLSKGLPAILNYAVSLGLDAVVEVINMKELQEVATLGIPIYGINLSVGLAISMPSIRQDISKSLIGEVPFGASSMVGVYSVDEARTMKYAGADAVYVRHEVLHGPQATEKNPQVFLENLRVAMSGDD